MQFPLSIKIERKGGGAAKLRDVESIQKERPPVTFEERVTKLKESDSTGISIRVRRDTSPRGYLKKRWKLLDIDLSTFHSEVSDEGGGGSYTAEICLNDIPMTLDGSNRLERYEFDVIGPDKYAKKKEETKEDKGSIFIDKFIKFFSDPEKLVGLISGINVLFGRNGRESQAQMMASIVDTLSKLREMTPNSTAQIKEAIGMINEIKKAEGPPVQTTGALMPAGGGFLEQIVRGAAPTLEKFFNQQAAQAPATGTLTPQLPQSTDQTQKKAPQKSSGGLPAVNPLLAVRQMIAEKADPTQVATYIVDAIDTYVKFSTGEVPVEYKGLLDNPGAAFERFSNHSPELAQDQEYRQALKANVVKLTEQWKAMQGGGSADVVQPDNISRPEPEPESGEVIESESGSAG